MYYFLGNAWEQGDGDNQVETLSAMVVLSTWI